MVRLLAGALALVLCVPATAHEAASGWAYDTSCCSDRDCHEIDAGEVRATDMGWLVEMTGETIPYSSRKLKRSGDGYFHRCTWAGEPDGSTICLYVPSGS